MNPRFFLCLVLVTLPLLAVADEPELGHERVASSTVRSTEPTVPYLLAVGINGGLGFASGGFFDDSDAGFLYGGSLRLGLSPKYYLTTYYQHTDLGLGLTTLLSAISGVDIDTGVSQYGLSAGMLVRPSRGYSLGMYMEAGLGVARYEFSAHGNGVDLENTENRLMARFGLGAMFPLSETVAFELGMTPAIKLSGDDGEGGAVVIGLHTGLVVSFH